MKRLNESTRALLAVVSTFVIGFVVGCGADRTLLNPPSYAAAHSAQRDVARHHDEVLAALRTELQLSDEQDARVRDILASRQTEVQEAWEQVHANLQRAMQQTTAEIETVLDSAQVQRFRGWIAERHGPGHATHLRRGH
jgi:succinate dehydrogenase/fumarate reductase flavoprotein subunit